MNVDVLKSLGYLKKSLKMNIKAFSNDNIRFPNNVTENQPLMDKVMELINMIEAVENASTSSVSSVSNTPVVSSMTTANILSTPIDNNGVTFLDP